MIIRPQQHWFRRLLGWHGSVLPHIMFRLGLNLAMSVIAILTYQWYQGFGFRLTIAPFSLLGVSIAIFLGFRNNASYARFIEARVLWGSMVITHRSLLRQIKSILPQQEQAAREFAALQMAFSWSLKHQLRETNGREDLLRLVPERWRNEVMNSPLPTNRLLLCMGTWLGEQRSKGAISDILWQSVDANLNQLSAIMTGCERIAGTPIPFAYTLILHRTVYLFCSLLPFALAADLHFMTPLVSVFISYTFLSLESLAAELEEPFGEEPNHLPLNAMCVTIERNLRDMNDDLPLPAPALPDSNFVLN
ncbi:bestrophin family protein [Candidatus Pantoea multigeneris]|uniref:Ibestrophin n=1 Tax=Candidatus Pantoea multigeneris TaxID=2608357 RepID=A0ABX0RJN3_9GAMM|nr:bestrophin family ion channel [Pantoea multigeneris]NIF24333.1 hypothetical protein [Pantoea multigeneris]